MTASADEMRAGWAPAIDGAQELTLLDAVAAGGYALLLCAEDEAPRMVERLLAAAGGATNAVRLSDQAGGRGDVAPWICLAFGLAPFDPEPAPLRLAAFFREETESGRRPLLLVEAAGRLTKPELAALRRLTADGARCSVILIGPEEAADRLRAASPAPLAAVAAGLATEEEPETPRPEPAPKALDPFAVIARAGPTERRAAPPAARILEDAEDAEPVQPPAPAPRRRLPYGAGAAAAAAFLAVLVLGALYLIDTRPRPVVGETVVLAPAPEAPRPLEDSAAPPSPAGAEAVAEAAPAAATGPTAEPAPGEAPAPAPAPEAAEPPEPRVTIHHAAADRARAGELLLALRRAGFADVALWPVAEPPAATGVRYFDDADAEVAALLAAALKEAMPEGPSFTPELAPETAAPRGVLEIWLAG